MRKYAVVSIDVEEWFHLDYITVEESGYSMMDGLERFLQITKE